MNKKLAKELDAIVKFIWPDAKYEQPYDIENQNTLADIMYWYDPYKELYGMYEKLISDYTKKLTEQQMIWIESAVMSMLRRAVYIYYKNDDSILEEYKYLSYPSHIRKILFDNVQEFPQLIAAMAAWAVYQCDIRCLNDMIFQYPKLVGEGKKVFTSYFSDSLSKRRKDIFIHSLDEIQSVIETLTSFTDLLVFDEESGRQVRMALLYLKQGYDEKKTLEQLEKGKIPKRSKKKPIPRMDKTFTDRVDDPDSDRAALLRQLAHIRWQYNILSENPEDQDYIKKNIRSLTHIDWEEVDRLIDGEDRQLSSQMITFKEAVSQIKIYKVWNNIHKSCPGTLEVRYKYPDGKAGDINRGLALCYGVDHPEQLDALTWKVHVDPRKHYDIIDMMLNGNLGVINDREETKRIQSEPAAKFLIKYNNYAKLRAMTSSVYSGEGITRTDFFSIASSVQANYYHQLKDIRDFFYQELIVSTGTSARWKSEQQVFAVTRYEFPDAIYQYHTRWLGMQSLDVFIPSLSVGIEYQGKQHYEPVEMFGGDEGFKSVIERDARKRQLCIDNGVKLIYWKYDEPVSSDVLKEKLREQGKNSKEVYNDNKG